MPKRFLQLLLACTLCLSSHAVPLYVSASGQFSGSDTAGQLVAPNGLFNLLFAVDSNPTPVAGSVTTTGFSVPVAAFAYTLNGATVPANPSEIRFNTSANGGLFDVTFGSGLSAPQFIFEGAQIFTGTTAAPSFAIGSYLISSWTYSDAVNFDRRTPTASAATISAVPEPGSLTLALCGLAAVALRLPRVFQRK